MIKTRYKDYEIIKVYLSNDIFFIVNKNNTTIKIYKNKNYTFNDIVNYLKAS